MKKKTIGLITISIIVVTIICVCIAFNKESKPEDKNINNEQTTFSDSTNNKQTTLPDSTNSEKSETTITKNIEEINRQASSSIKIVEESTTSPYITLFDQYNKIEYIENSIEMVEEGVYKGIVRVSAPNFEEAFNKYITTHDDEHFKPECYEEILEEILSSAEIETSEYEIFFYINDNSELIPVINDNVINAMYGNIKKIYDDQLIGQNQKGE